jgi:hypothetical protein
VDGLTDRRFVVPPGWPRPPDGWVPPAGWRPDPGWPPPPPGWRFWQPAGPGPSPADPAPPPAGPRAELGRLRRENAALRTEIRRLEAAVEASNGELHRLLGADPMLVRAETERMLRDWDAAQGRLQSTLAQLAAAQRRLEAAARAETAADSGRWV